MTNTCPTCGRKPKTDGARFCGFDGTLLDQPKQTSEGPEMVCPACKRIFPSRAKFCPVDSEALVPQMGAPTQSGAHPTQRGSFAQEEEDRQNTALMNKASFHDQSLHTDSRPYLQEAPASGAPMSGFGRPQADKKKEEEEDLREVLAHTGGYTGNLVGKTIDGKYLIQSMLGEGGMAVVYRAHHTIMEREVVIKVMQGWLLSNEKSRERFQRECKLTAKLNHPNIVTVHDVGLINDRAPYLVMEFIKGESLAEKIRRQGALPFATAANIIIQICRGLQEAHNNGIIHRDLKPDNVLLQDRSDRPDWVKIVDFGISHAVHGHEKRLTKTGRMVGTPEYVAPEQLKDVPMDIRTDLYQLGIMLYEMLTGSVPFEGESAESILMKHLIEEPPPMSKYKPELAEGTPFDEIVIKLLRKDPDERYQTSTELRLDIEQAQAKVRLKRS